MRKDLVSMLLAMAISSGAGAEPQVKTKSGVVEGTASPEGLRVFKGIPFAQLPVGGLRWKAPQLVKTWQGIRKAQTFGPSPVQNSGMAMMIGVPGPFSEDCLYLNVWTPARQEQPLPVMVWIHGGGFGFGSTSQAIFDGTRLAQKGVAVVSVGYRVGVLGFPRKP